jgi:hypothetical protein
MIVGYDLSYLQIFTPFGDEISKEDIRKWPEVLKYGWTLNEWLAVIFKFDLFI